MSNSRTTLNDNVNVKQVASLFEDVQTRYLNKLISVDEKHLSQDERYKVKVSIYESYVKDLSIQTRLLLQSLEELEQEANQRVALLERKLRKVNGGDHHQSLSDNYELEKWKLNHENLDLRHDLHCLTSFINVAKRTGQWESQRLRLKTLSFDRIIGMTDDDRPPLPAINEEIQRIELLRTEIDQLRRFNQSKSDNEYKAQNLLLTNKIDDLRAKLSEECQRTETLKMELRLKSNQIKDLQCSEEQAKELKNNAEQQMEKEKHTWENQCRDLHRLCREKDTLIDSLQRVSSPVQLNISQVEYDKVHHELLDTRQQLDRSIAEAKLQETSKMRLEDDRRRLKEIHEEHLERLQNEIRALKRLCDDQSKQVNSLSSQLNRSSDQKQCRDVANEQFDQMRNKAEEAILRREHLEQSLEDSNLRCQALERQWRECLHRLEERNELLVKNEEDLIELQRHSEEKQIRLDQLEKGLIEKSAQVAELNERLTNEQIKNQHREQTFKQNQTRDEEFSEQIRHLSEGLIEAERKNHSLTQRIQQVNNELRVKHEECQQIEKKLHKQLTIRDDHLIRSDQTLHDEEIRLQYAQEECHIQEKEIQRLTSLQEEQTQRIQLLQQDLIELQQQNVSLTVRSDQSDLDLRTLKIHRDDENRRSSEEIDRLSEEICLLKSNEAISSKSILELKENVHLLSTELESLREENQFSANECDNLQRLLHEETESHCKSSSSVTLLTRQIEQTNRRANQATDQFNDLRMQLQSSTLVNETLRSELSQTRFLLEEQTNKDLTLKELGQELSCSLDESRKTIDAQEREIERLNVLLSTLQFEYQHAKEDLSLVEDRLVQLKVQHQTLEQHFNEKNQEFTSLTTRSEKIQQDFHHYEKEHRYSNEEFFQREQHSQTIQNHFTDFIREHRTLKGEHQRLEEELEHALQQLDQIKQSDLLQTESLMQSIDQSQIYKEKLSLLGECLSALIRKSSETSERWANLHDYLDERLTSLTKDVNELQSVDERCEQSIRLLNVVQSQQDEVRSQSSALRPKFEKFHSFLRQVQHRQTRLNEDLDEQQTTLLQLRKDLSQERQTSNQFTLEREQIIKNLVTANEKISRLDLDLRQTMETNRAYQQTNEKLENQLADLHKQKENIRKTSEDNEQSYQQNITECESLVVALRESNERSLHALEEKTIDWRQTQTEIEAIKDQLITADAKLEKFDQITSDYRRHISLLERSIDEHKRLVRRRDKELEDLRLALSIKHDTENVFSRENFPPPPKEQQRRRRTRKDDCHQPLNFIDDGIQRLS